MSTWTPGTESVARRVTRGALLGALAIILPLGAHAAGVSGVMLLPMHLPVLIGGFLLDPVTALLVAVVAPVVNFLITGMPPLQPPILIVMLFELAGYALTASLLTRHTRWRVEVILLLSMLAGRLLLAAAVAGVAPLFGWPVHAWGYVSGAVVTGLPGLLLQFILIPPIVRAVRDGNST